MTSDARRTAVAQAIANAPWNDEWDLPDAYAQADAAIAALLPDRAAFRKQVESIIEARFRFADDPCEMWEGEWMQRWHDMEMMVFGASDVWDHYFNPNGVDDAQAGEQEGAEHGA